ncbi:MAG: hypothetical protein N2Z69_04580 [Methylophilaceae bacterium]|nr:hypothetical protein [Methylophilaceae bacterium]
MDFMRIPHQAADVPVAGVVITPPTEGATERRPHLPDLPKGHRKPPFSRQKGGDGDVEKKPDRDGHLVDEYA